MSARSMMRSARREMQVADDMFEEAVDRDLFGSASQSDLDLLMDEPERWRACLAVRRNIVENILPKDGATYGTVEVTDGQALWSFRMRVGGVTKAERAKIIASVASRQSAAIIAARGPAASVPNHDKLRMMVLDALIAKAIDFVPPEEAAWHEVYDAMIREMRNGVGLTSERYWEDGVGPKLKQIRNEWEWMAERVRS